MSGPAAEAAAVVELRRFSKWYGDVVAVADLSFELRPGVTGLLGPFVDWLFGAGFDQGTLADQAGFTGPGYLVAMAVVVAVAAALLIWRVLRLRP